MRTKTHYAEMPPAYTVEHAGSSGAIITLVANAEVCANGDETGYMADVYTLNTAYAPDLPERLEANYDVWMEHAKALDYEKEAVRVRALRDALLAASDKDMVLDRMGLVPPTGSTFSAWLAFLRGIGNALTGAKAAYRQALRDIPAQEGFPYDVAWPALVD